MAVPNTLVAGDVIFRDKGAVIYTDVKPMNYVYRWVSTKSLSRVADNVSESGRIKAFHKNKDIPNVFENWPKLFNEEHGLLFSSTHPIAALHGGFNELYGDILLKIKIDSSKARVVLVNEPPWALHRPMTDPFHFSNVDIIIRKGPIREVIILNPDVIIDVTADPRVLAPELSAHLQRLRDPNFRYASEDLHISREVLGDFNYSLARTTIENLLSMDISKIPLSLLRPMASEGENYSLQVPPISSDEFSKWFLKRYYQLLIKMDDEGATALAKAYREIFLPNKQQGHLDIYNQFSQKDIEAFRLRLTGEKVTKLYLLGNILSKFLRSVLEKADTGKYRNAVESLGLKMARHDNFLRWIESNNRTIDVFSREWELRGDPLSPFINRIRSLNQCKSFYLTQ